YPRKAAPAFPQGLRSLLGLHRRRAGNRPATEKIMILEQNQFRAFKEWLDLDVNSIAWEGRFADSFGAFWESFFKDQIKPRELGERFNYAKRIAKSGPLISWLSWLYDKYLVFAFIHLDLSVREISLFFDIAERDVATIIRDHLIKVHPTYEDFINESFQI